jgi:hypothetical protein
LSERGILPYQHDFYELQREIDAKLDSATDETAKAALKIEGDAHMKGLDKVYWDIENDGRLQAAAMAAAARLGNEISGQGRVIIISEILNAAHLATRRLSFDEKPFDDEGYKFGLKRLQDIHAAVFQKRLEYGRELTELGIMPQNEIETLEDMNPDDIDRFEQGTRYYSELMVMHFLTRAEAGTTIGRFQELQAVLYIGHTMGIQDANTAAAKQFASED